MNQRLPLVLSTTALVVALVGSTPLGNAAQNALEQVPRAKRADFASNAGKLNGHKSSLSPKRGQIPVVGADGKLPASIGAVGPKGEQGPAGPAGVGGYQIRTENITVPDNDQGIPTFGVSCPGGRVALGAGYSFAREAAGDNALRVFDTRPVSDSTWRFRVSNETSNAKPMTLYVTCANISS
jgi:hypothetical protein